MRLFKTGAMLYRLETIGYTFEGTVKQLTGYWNDSGYRPEDLKTALRELKRSRQECAFLGIQGSLLFCGDVLIGGSGRLAS